MTRTTDHGSEARVSRREAVGLLATGAATLGARLPAAAAVTETPPVPGLIRAENAKPGTRDWMLAHVEIDPAATYRSPAIEGYCSHASVLAGDTLTIHVSTRPARPFTIDLYRMGWYGGDGGRLVASLGAFAGTSRDDPPVGAKRLRRCTWPATTAVTIPVDWPSGAYVGKLACRGDEAAPGPQSYVVFIVRDTRPADLVFQCSDFSWQAYNRWPDQFALYDDGDQKWYWGGGLEIVATGPTQSAPGKPNGGTYTATVYDGPRGNVVFNAATCWWADGLSAPPGYVRPSVYTSPQGPDDRLRRITANVLGRMLSER